MKISDIKPQEHGVSDKYSWHFYRHLKAQGMKQRILWDNSDGRPMHPMSIYVLNGTIGNTLQSIMWGSKNIVCFSMHPLDTYVDITESFWKSYVSKGRCMFDENHSSKWWVGDKHRYQSINRNSKRCRWCGVILRRNIVTTKVIERNEEWVVDQ